MTTNVFVTGGTGVLGSEAVRQLVAAGYSVRALAHTDRAITALRELGAEPMPGSLFDSPLLKAALTGAEAVLHLATRIPSSAKRGGSAAWRENGRIRDEGTYNLVDAALAANVRTVLYSSVAYVYPDGGDAWIDAATTPPSDEARGSTVPLLALVRRILRRVRGCVGRRYGNAPRWPRSCGRCGVGRRSGRLHAQRRGRWPCAGLSRATRHDGHRATQWHRPGNAEGSNRDPGRVARQ